MKINWSTVLLGLIITGLGLGASITGSFEMSNFGVDLEGSHARLSGAVLSIFGLCLIYTGVHRKAPKNNPRGTEADDNCEED